MNDKQRIAVRVEEEDAQHTPGPWCHSDTVLWATVTTKANGGGETLAVVGAPFNGERRGKASRDDETRANARLIAAAPDGLEANHAALTVLAMIKHEGAAAEHIDAAIVKLEAAIAKARGGA